MGGVTINERQARPWQDMLISAAGPFASFGIAGICYLILGNVEYVHRDRMFAVLVPLLVLANFWWGVFNLLPIPPLDGGKAFRNLLRSLLREKPAFMIAVWTAMIVGIGVVVYGVATRDYFLAAIIGWFTFSNFQQWQDYRHRGFPGD
jgi:Zn-dependent protease